MNFRNFINSRFGVKQSDDSLNKKTDDCEKQPSYVIKSPHCGRDENGNFNCVCGKCVNQLPK